MYVSENNFFILRNEHEGLRYGNFSINTIPIKIVIGMVLKLGNIDKVEDVGWHLKLTNYKVPDRTRI